MMFYEHLSVDECIFLSMYFTILNTGELQLENISAKVLTELIRTEVSVRCMQHWPS